MRSTSSPGVSWLLGVVIVALLAGGIATVATDDPPAPIVETVIDERVVLPEGQAEISGRVDRLVADDANGEPLPMPLALETGTASIEGAIVDGKRAAIVWDGGRPFRLTGSGTVDLGPTHVEVDAGSVRWTIGGLRILTPGDYRLDTPVAVGSGGLAEPRDSVGFSADEETTIDAATDLVVANDLPVHLEGPGSFRAEGELRVRTRDGTTTATHLEFGPGPFVIDIEPDGTFNAIVNGDLTSS